MPSSLWSSQRTGAPREGSVTSGGRVRTATTGTRDTATPRTRHILHVSPSSSSQETNRTRTGVAHHHHHDQHHGKLRLHSGVTRRRRTIARVYPREKYKYTQGREKPLDPDVADVLVNAVLIFGVASTPWLLDPDNVIVWVPLTAGALAVIPQVSTST
mmetsp:Transcript_9515/g.27061  ORF Transcript_9515/g.27061 Transcript_9515/m.27061 type:complete len:158 (-) Transcript_9515:55-528(-)